MSYEGMGSQRCAKNEARRDKKLDADKEREGTECNFSRASWAEPNMTHRQEPEVRALRMLAQLSPVEPQPNYETRSC